MKNKLKLPFKVGSLWAWHDGGKDSKISVEKPWLALVTEINPDHASFTVEWFYCGDSERVPTRRFSIALALQWLDDGECFFI